MRCFRCGLSGMNPSCDRSATVALHPPEPTQDIHRENCNASSGGNASQRLLSAGFPMSEPIAADHDCNKTCNLRDRASEKTLDGVKSGVERRTLCHRGHGHHKKKREKR